jgi:hypothetical protein
MPSQNPLQAVTFTVNKEDKEEWSEMHCGDAAGSAS